MHCSGVRKKAIEELDADMDPVELSNSVKDIFDDQLLRQLPSPSEVPNPIVVDIGAGLGMYDIHVSRYYKGNSTHFMVDKSMDEVPNDESATSGGWHSDRLKFYNSQECSKKIAMENGVAGSSWNLVDATEDNVKSLGDGKVDVVISLLSWGWHYPIATYMDAVKQVLKPGSGRLIVTVRDENRKKKRGEHSIIRGEGGQQKLAEAGFACDEHHWEQQEKGKLLSCRLSA